MPPSIKKNHHRLIERFSKSRILVIGDVMLDTYSFGGEERISPEAPIPILGVTEIKYRLGGAGNAAGNVSALGSSVTLLSVVGRDRARIKIQELAHQARLQADLFTDASRPTTEKNRFISRGQQVFRVDRESNKPIAASLENRIIKKISAIMPNLDAVLISDYNKGTVTLRLLQNIFAACHRRKIVAVVDGKTPDVRRYRGANIFTPSHHDAKNMTGIETVDNRSARQVASILGKRLNSVILLTLGEAGILLRTKEGKARIFRSVAKRVYDSTGAGDTVAAALTVALAAGANLPVAVEMANHAAGIVVGKFGTAVVTRKELLNRI